MCLDGRQHLAVVCQGNARRSRQADEAGLAALRNHTLRVFAEFC
jgi:hypothetical protein